MLGIRFQNTLASTIERIWTHLATSIKGLAQDMYARDLNLIQRIHVTHTYLLPKIWYCAQTLPISREHARQITVSILWFIWHGQIFRSPTSILHCPKAESGLSLLHVYAKCLILFITCIFLQRRKRGTVTAV
jgi:hypothetical protein